MDCWPCSSAGGVMSFPCMERVGRTHFRQLLNSPQEAFWLRGVISHNLWWVVLWLSSFPKSRQTRFNNQSNILWEPKLDRSIPRQSHCDCARNMVLQKSEASGWDHYLNSSGRNYVFQYLSAGCWNPLLPSPFQTPDEPYIFSCNIYWVKLE